MKSYYEKVIRKYFVACSILGIVLVALWIVIYFTTQSYIGAILSLLVMLLLMKVAIRFIANKTLLSVLFEKLDAAEFQKIVNDNRFAAPLTYRINAAISVGDYQEAINIATKQLHNEKLHIKIKHYYLYVLARAYFELRDLEKLDALLAKYEKYKEQYPSKSFSRTPNSVWSYYRHFLEQNYEACKIVCKERNLEIKPKAWDSKIRKLQNNFYYAVACYENGETAAAKASFEEIISSAPKLYIASISQKYLDMIGQNQLLLLSETAVLPDNSYQLYDERITAKMRRHKILIRVGVIVAAVLLVLNAFFDYIDKKQRDEISLFELKLNDALTEEYGKATWIDHFGLEKKEVYVDSLCLVETGDELDLVEVVSEDKEETFDVLRVIEDIELNSYYCVKGPSSNYYIGFMISSTAPSVRSLYYLLEFKHKNDTCWFYIDYIEMTPRS